MTVLSDMLSYSNDSDMERALTARSANVFANMQRGLVYHSPHNCYAMYGTIKPDEKDFALTRQGLGLIMTYLRACIHEDYGESHTSVVVGVSLHLWSMWAEQENFRLPSGMCFRHPTDDPLTPDVFTKGGRVYSNIGGALCFTIKSNSIENVEKLEKILAAKMFDLKIQLVMGPEFTNSRGGEVVTNQAESNCGADKNKTGRVLGCRFSESLQNPSSPIEVLDQVLVGGTAGSGGKRQNERSDSSSPEPNSLHHGASFALIQRFLIDWNMLHSIGDSAIEDTLGRKERTDQFLPAGTPDSHIKCSHTPDADGDTIRILRLGQPFGTSSRASNPTNRTLGHTQSDEEGLCKSPCCISFTCSLPSLTYVPV
eukprot:scaffold107569_cov61-Attheya_sp.AAC.5